MGSKYLKKYAFAAVARLQTHFGHKFGVCRAQKTHLAATSVFFIARGTDSAPQDSLVGIEGLLRDKGKRGEKGGREGKGNKGREGKGGRKHPSPEMKNLVTAW